MESGIRKLTNRTWNKSAPCASFAFVTLSSIKSHICMQIVCCNANWLIIQRFSALPIFLGINTPKQKLNKMKNVINWGLPSPLVTFAVDINLTAKVGFVGTWALLFPNVDHWRHGEKTKVRNRKEHTVLILVTISLLVDACVFRHTSVLVVILQKRAVATEQRVISFSKHRNLALSSILRWQTEFES